MCRSLPARRASGLTDQNPGMVDLYALAYRFGIDLFARMCVFRFEDMIYEMTRDITHGRNPLTEHAKVSRVIVKLGPLVEALYDPDSGVPAHDRQLRIPLLQLAAWLHHLLTNDEQKEEFDRLLEISGTFARELLDHIKSVMSS
jgi:hypothetical protein